MILTNYSRLNLKRIKCCWDKFYVASTVTKSHSKQGKYVLVAGYSDHLLFYLELTMLRA